MKESAPRAAEGPILYTVDAFVEKNRDALYPHCAAAVGATARPLVGALFPRATDDAADDSNNGHNGHGHKKGGALTIASRFIHQVSNDVSQKDWLS